MGFFKKLKRFFKEYKAIDVDFYDDLEELFVMGDVGIAQSEEFIEELKSTLHKKLIYDADEAMDVLKENVLKVLEADRDGHEYDFEKKKSVILVVGVNGVGKTTTIGKLAAMYKAQGKKIVIVTHHNPRTPDELPEYSWEHGDVYTAYWVVNHELDDLKPDIWICGHIHEDLDTEIDGVRFIRHPIGYRWGWYGMRPEKFPEHQKIMDSWYNKVIEINSNPTMESEMAFYRKLSDEQAERSERMMYE